MTATFESSSRHEPIPVHLLDGDVLYYERAFQPPTADSLFAALTAETPWQQHRIRIAGREIPCPRLSAWVGDSDAAYAYSGFSLQPAAWTPLLQTVKTRVEELTGARFNSVLLNLYRTGRDSVSWHADDEPELGPEPTIASVSLGAVRRFVLRHAQDRDAAPISIPLAHGSMLLMSGRLQEHWQHCVPKTAKPVGERLNLTFRRIVERGR